MITRYIISNFFTPLMSMKHKVQMLRWRIRRNKLAGKWKYGSVGKHYRQ